MSRNRLHLEMLTDEQLLQIEETAYRLLSEVGISLQHETAADMLHGLGCRVEGERVFIPGDVIHWAMAIAIPDPRLRDKRQRITLEGEIPSPRNPPFGCAFHPRCRYAEERCAVEAPLLAPFNGDERLTACHFPEKVQTVLAWE